jgi:hypothetical protein
MDFSAGIMVAAALSDIHPDAPQLITHSSITFRIAASRSVRLIGLTRYATTCPSASSPSASGSCRAETNMMGIDCSRQTAFAASNPAEFGHVDVGNDHFRAKRPALFHKFATVGSSRN